MKRFFSVFILIYALMSTGCMRAYIKSVGGDIDTPFSKIFLTDRETAWQSVLDALKSYNLDISNPSTGMVQTRWTENTALRNFVDAYGGSQTYLKAKFRYRVLVSEGFYNGVQSVKITVRKAQIIQQDVLEGWVNKETDGIEEETLLYRIGRLISMKIRIRRVEQEKRQRAIEKTNFDEPIEF